MNIQAMYIWWKMDMLNVKNSANSSKKIVHFNDFMYRFVRFLEKI